MYISLPTIVKSLKNISKGKIINTKSKVVSEAQGLLFHMMNLKFSFLLVMWKNILEKAYILSNYLQNSSIDLITALNMVEVCSEDIIATRTTEEFFNIQRNAIILCEKFDGATEFYKPQKKKKTKFFDEIGINDTAK